jgi:hypothetical protein
MLIKQTPPTMYDCTITYEVTVVNSVPNKLYGNHYDEKATTLGIKQQRYLTVAANPDHGGTTDQ